MTEVMFSGPPLDEEAGLGAQERDPRREEFELDRILGPHEPGPYHRKRWADREVVKVANGTLEATRLAKYARQFRLGQGGFQMNQT